MAVLPAPVGAETRTDFSWSIAPMAFAPTPTTLRVFGLLFGIGLGGDYMIIPLMAAELFGAPIMGRLLGIVLTADGVAEAVAPMGVAMIRDRTGSYTGGFLLLVVLAALGALAVSALPGRTMRADDAVEPRRARATPSSAA